MNPLFDPKKAAITLRWSVVVKEADEDRSDGELRVINVTTEPASDPQAWPVEQFCRENGVEFVQGDYKIKCEFGDDQEIKTSIGLPETFESFGAVERMTGKLRDLFTAPIEGQVLALSKALENAPSDDEIKTGARSAVRCSAQALLEPLPPTQQGGRYTVRDLSNIKSGFVHLKGVACAGCGDQGSVMAVMVEPGQDVFGTIQEAMNGREKSTFSFGQANGFVRVTDGPIVEVGVGFAHHDLPYAQALNDQLAAHMRDAVAAVEAEVIADGIGHLHPMALGHLRAIEQLAHGFKIELPMLHASVSMRGPADAYEIPRPSKNLSRPRKPKYI